VKQGEAQQRHQSALQQNLFLADTAPPVHMRSSEIVQKIHLNMFAKKKGQGGPGERSSVRAKGITAEFVSRAHSASRANVLMRDCA